MYNNVAEVDEIKYNETLEVRRLVRWRKKGKGCTNVAPHSFLY